jgi:hypothetical protein
LTKLETLTEQASELGKEAKESMEDLSRSAGRKFDRARDETGEALHTAAASVRRTSRQGCDAIDNLAAGAADRLDASASFVEDQELEKAFTGVRRFASRHLALSMIVAVAIGFVAGSALCRSTHSCD